MVLRTLQTPFTTASIVALKNAALVVWAQFVTGTFATIAALNTSPVTIDGLLDALGPRMVALVFALLGAFWRWFRFRLSFRMGASGCLFSMTLAFIIGDGQIPYADLITKNIAKESIPMMNGFLMGLFGLLLVTGVQDFMAAYRAARELGEKI